MKRTLHLVYDIVSFPFWAIVVAIMIIGHITLDVWDSR